jgi:Flp pilus assembly pilin Flp
MLLGFYTRLQAMWLGVRSRFEDENGAVATEYVVLLVLIALGIIVGAAVLAGAINNNFNCASDSIATGITESQC